MGILNRIFGSDESQAPSPQVASPSPPQAGTPATGQAPPSDNEMAVARYRYLLRTAPPETLEQAHVEAFEKLTPEQRRLALLQIAQADPEAQNTTADDPQTLARLATRAEVRQPGFLERAFGGGGGIGMGGIVAGGFLSSLAGTLVGSAIAQSFFANPINAAGFAQSGFAPGGIDTGDTITNNYYSDAAPADNTTAVGGTSTGDASDVSSDPDAGGFADMTGTDMGGDMGDLGGFDV